jgi:hypothetical protein
MTQGLMELKNKIMDLALGQPYMPDTIPLVFLSLEEKIGGTAAAPLSLSPRSIR